MSRRMHYMTRAEVIHKYVREAARRSGTVNALEVGRLRNPIEAIGHSTLHIASEPSVTRLVSIDTNAATEGVCRALLPDACLAKTLFANGDGTRLLGAERPAEWPVFDFIYLDAANDAEQGMELFRLCVSPRNAKPGTIIVMDDTDHPATFKGDLAVPWATAHNVNVIEHVPRDSTCQGLSIFDVGKGCDA